MVDSSSSAAMTKKAEEIQQVLLGPQVDLWRLRELALSEGGLVNDTLRRRAWPKLIGLNVALETVHPSTPPPPASSFASSTKNHSNAGIFRGSENAVADSRSQQPLFQPFSSSISSFQEEEENSTREDASVSSEMVVIGSNGEEVHETSLSFSKKASQCTDSLPSAGDFCEKGPELGAFFRHVNNNARAAQPLQLHRDDISISSCTTASMSNMGGTTPGSRRSSSRLPILAMSLDFRQIELDVQRCTWHLLTGDQRIQRIQMEHKRNRKVARLIRRKQRRLANLINYTLVQSYPLTNPDKMRYYQGFHDVACVFMSTLGGGTAQRAPDAVVPKDMQQLACAMGLDLPARVLVQISQSHLRDFLKSDFTELKTAIDLTIFPLMAKLDPTVHDFLRDAEMQPFFALSWVITWFAHEVRSTEVVKRLFDVFLVSHPLMPIYLSVAMVLHPVNRRILLASDQDFGTVHQTLRNLTKNSCMTGWKYRPGDGYVSDDEEAEEDEEEGEELEQAGIAGDFDRIRNELQNKTHDQNGTQSSVSTCAESFTETQIRVPFQELIDLALRFMNRVPPRKLLPLSVRYYGGPHVSELLARSPTIRLFSDPADWAIKSQATADWVLQQRAQALMLDGGEEGFPLMEDNLRDSEPLREVLLRKRKSPAVIALGFGEGDDKMKRRRRRRKIAIAGVGVALIAIAVGVAFGGFSFSNSEDSSRSVVPNEGEDPGACTLVLDELESDCDPLLDSKDGNTTRTSQQEESGDHLDAASDEHCCDQDGKDSWQPKGDSAHAGGVVRFSQNRWGKFLNDLKNHKAVVLAKVVGRNVAKELNKARKVRLRPVFEELLAEDTYFS